jgi:raffinose/stachyose/melibiose transport system permease protein
MVEAKKKGGTLLTVLMSILSLAWIYPVVLILINSIKEQSSITTDTIFNLPDEKTFAGLQNYITAITKNGFVKYFWYSLFITVSSLALILVCCSMCAWYITRVQNIVSKGMYYLCVFSMIVPFQMVMFTLTKMANVLHLDTPYTICVIYLGFGAGLAVFMFCGFMKSIPLEIEEAAMIDGCNALRTFFSVVMPILKPTMISTAILEAMWLWNDYLLPSLVLDRTKGYMTLPIMVQYFRGGYGSVDMGALMASIVMIIIPVIIFYLVCQKYIIEGVMAGAVKG